jgi:hypothetical protein
VENIHVIPTDKPSRLSILNSGKLNFGAEIMSSSNSKPQNIYITNDEEIKGRDYYIHNNKVMQSAGAEQEKGDYKNCKKIILTTDQDLIKEGVQSIDDEFLEFIVKNPSCEEVKVEKEFIQTPDNLKDGFYYKIIISSEEPKQDALNHFLSTSDVIVKDPQKFDYKNTVLPKEEPDYTALLQLIGTKQESFVERMKPLQEQWQKDMDKELMKEETLEEAAEKKYGLNDKYSRNRLGFIEGAKWQQEINYSDMEEYSAFVLKSYKEGLPLLLAKEWFEQFKNK